MSDKVVLTQEQADEIELQKKDFSKFDDIVTRRILTSDINGYYNKTFHSISVDDLIKALYIGYEVEPEFKVGDWVIDEEYGFIGQITEIEGNSIWAYWDDDNKEMRIRKEDLRHATPEEIAKERRWWKSHNLDVWELKINDMIYSKVTKTYDEVVFVFRSGSVNLKGTTPNDFNQYGVNTVPKEELNNHNFKVICFAEDRKDV